MEQKIKILQINRSDFSKGGTSIISWELFQKHKALASQSKLLVGWKYTKDPFVAQIPKDYPTNSWQKFWFKLENKTKPFIGKMKGAGRLGNFFHHIGWPKNLTQKRKVPYFSSTRQLLDSCPFEPNIVHIHSTDEDYFDVKILPRLSKQIPTILTLHCELMFTGCCECTFECEKWRNGCQKCHLPSPLNHRAPYNLEQKQNIYKNSKLHLITPSRWLMNKAKESILQPAILSSHVIPNGIDLTIFKPGNKIAARKKNNLPQDAHILLFVAWDARTNTQKDYQTLKKALLIINNQKKSSEKIVLYCIGDRHKTIKHGSIEIHFIDYIKNREELVSYYQAGDLLVHATKTDNFPTTVLEAMACGLPVIGTRLGGLPEQITEYKTGLLYEKENSAELAEKISYLLKNKQIREKMSIASLKKTQEQYDLEKQAKKHLQLYKKIISQPATKPNVL